MPTLTKTPVTSVSATRRDDDERELFALAFALANLRAYAVVGERDFRDENDVRAAGDARVERNPTGITAHDLQDHHAIVALGRGVQPVERVGRTGHGGIEAERHQC